MCNHLLLFHFCVAYNVIFFQTIKIELNKKKLSREFINQIGYSILDFSWYIYSLGNLKILE